MLLREQHGGPREREQLELLREVRQGQEEGVGVRMVSQLQEEVLVPLLLVVQ